MVCVEQALYYVFARSSREIILPAPTPTQHASYAFAKTRFIGLVCTGVVPPDKRRATRPLTRYVFKLFLVLAVHVRAKHAFVSPRDHFHRTTAMIAALSSPRCCYRQKTSTCTVYDVYTVVYTIKITEPIKCTFDLLHFPLCSLFSYPPQYISPDFCYCVLHPRHTCVAPRLSVGGGCRERVHLKITSDLAISLVFMYGGRMAMFNLCHLKCLFARSYIHTISRTVSATSLAM